MILNVEYLSRICDKFSEGLHVLKLTSVDVSLEVLNIKVLVQVLELSSSCLASVVLASASSIDNSKVLEILLLIKVLKESWSSLSNHRQVLKVLLLIEVLKPGSFERNIDELLKFRLQSVQVLKE